MSLSIGIVGLPNVGKSTLFNALTDKSVPAENYPFCTVDPSVGIVKVPDERLEKLSEFSASRSTIPAAVEFVDIAGLIRGASKGEGLGNAFLQNIREVDMIAHVVRIFEDSSLMHVEGSILPARDMDTINSELIFADLETLAKRLTKIEREVKRGDKEAVKEKEVIEKAQHTLTEGIILSGSDLDDEDREVLYHLHLLTMKQMLYVFNKKAGSLNLDEVTDERYDDLIRKVEESGVPYVTVDAGIESELQGLSSEEKGQFRQEMGGGESGIDELISTGYSMLDLITFFTTGEDETRAWTTAKGSTAPEAGRVLHSDFHDKFIRADIIEWNTLLESGSYREARDQGLVRTEGKEYIVKDGDVIEFKI